VEGNERAVTAAANTAGIRIALMGLLNKVVTPAVNTIQRLGVPGRKVGWHR
jgi:hypothetical protein